MSRDTLRHELTHSRLVPARKSQRERGSQQVGNSVFVGNEIRCLPVILLGVCYTAEKLARKRPRVRLSTVLPPPCGRSDTDHGDTRLVLQTEEGHQAQSITVPEQGQTGRYGR